MNFLENVPLAPYTTFKIGGPARYFCVVENQQDALTAYEFAIKEKLPVFVLGGGSNLLVSDRGFKGLVVKIANKGIEVISEDAENVFLKVSSGEIWDEVVNFATKNNWWGIENLSHIPGSTGAIAVQNVGAYGQEASKVIDSVGVFNTETHNILSIKAKDCEFGYRKSIFNSTKKNKYIIFHIIFKLKKHGSPCLNYPDLKKYFEGKNPFLSEIREAVTQIRNKKYPFPTQAKNGNAGSFFKNPVLDLTGFETLKQKIQTNFGDNKLIELETKSFFILPQVKVPAAYLIDICGLKNHHVGGACINPTQPLIILNENGSATAEDVINLAEFVKREVNEKTGIMLSFEPVILGFN